MKTSVLLSSLIALFWLGSEIRSAEGGDYVPEELTCQLVDSAFIETINSDYNTSIKSYLPQIASFLLQAPAGLDLDSLSVVIEARPEVVYCHPNYLLDAPEPVQGSQPFVDLNSDLSKFTDQKASGQINLGAARPVSTGSNVMVGVIDAGVNLSHPLLSSTTAAGIDYVDGDNMANDEPGGMASGHGTFVAGVVKLVAPDAQVLPYRVLNTDGRGNGYTIAEAVLQAVEDGCKVINISMVMAGQHGSLDFAIEYARNNNVVIVAAAGNDSVNSDLFPAKDSYTLSVAAVDTLNHKADFSSYGGKVDLVAPGTRIYAPFLDDDFAWWDGTSFASPFVAGQAALLFSLNPSATWNEIIEAMTSTAIEIDSLNPGLEGDLGFGLINPLASMDNFGFVCGDANMSGGEPTIADIGAIVDHLFITGADLPLQVAADANGSGDISIADIGSLVDYLFITGSPLNCLGN